jgi:histidinol dehydrogenase
MPADGPAPLSLARNGGIVVSRTLGEAVELTQRLAPEHVVCDSDAIAVRLTRAGTVFVGDYSAQACGDYVTGSNHVLPTGGAAAGRGGLSAADFVRVSTVQKITAAGLRRIAPAGVALARAEGLSAHAASMTIRSHRPTAPAAPEPGGSRA